MTTTENKSTYKLVEEFIYAYKHKGSSWTTMELREEINYRGNLDLSLGAISTILVRIKQRGNITYNGKKWTFIFQNTDHLGNIEPPAPIKRLSLFFKHCAMYPIEYEKTEFDPVHQLAESIKQSQWLHTLIAIWKARKDPLHPKVKGISSSLDNSTRIATTSRGYTD